MVYNQTMFRSLVANSKLAPVTALLAVIAIAIFGPGHFFGMETKSDGTMRGCIFSGNAALCSMGLIEHITQWQNLFSAIPIKTILALGIIVLISLVLGQRRQNLLSGQMDLPKQFSNANDHGASIFNPLKLAFSQGILHPKVYNF